MTGRGWKRCRTSDKPNALRFDILEGRFIRLRDRSADCPVRGRAYVVIDILTGRTVPEQTDYRAKESNGQT